MGCRVRLNTYIQVDIGGRSWTLSRRCVALTVFMQLPRLYTTDTKALSHILMNSQTYQKPEVSRYAISRIVGPASVLVVEGEKHKQQASRNLGPFQSPVLTCNIEKDYGQRLILKANCAPFSDTRTRILHSALHRSESSQKSLLKSRFRYVHMLCVFLLRMLKMA